jgi:hypothetical protein
VGRRPALHAALIHRPGTDPAPRCTRDLLQPSLPASARAFPPSSALAQVSVRNVFGYAERLGAHMEAGQHKSNTFRLHATKPRPWGTESFLRAELAKTVSAAGGVLFSAHLIVRCLRGSQGFSRPNLSSPPTDRARKGSSTCGEGEGKECHIEMPDHTARSGRCVAHRVRCFRARSPARPHALLAPPSFSVPPSLLAPSLRLIPCPRLIPSPRLGPCPRLRTSPRLT